MILGLFTGSRVYGDPNRDSDLDLVLLVTPEDMTVLMGAAKDDFQLQEHKSDYDKEHDTRHFRFGRINVIATTDPVAFAVWQEGTRQLLETEECIGRERAVNTFRQLREKHGLIRKEPAKGDRLRRTRL